MKKSDAKKHLKLLQESVMIWVHCYFCDKGIQFYPHFDITKFRDRNDWRKNNDYRLSFPICLEWICEDCQKQGRTIQEIPNGKDRIK